MISGNKGASGNQPVLLCSGILRLYVFMNSNEWDAEASIKMTMVSFNLSDEEKFKSYEILCSFISVISANFDFSVILGPEVELNFKLHYFALDIYKLFEKP